MPPAPLITLAKSLERWLAAFGVFPRTTCKALAGIRGYLGDYVKALAHRQKDWPVHPSFPCLTEKEGDAGSLADPYFLQDFFVAKKIFERNPRRHVDVGSRIDGFVAHVALFRPIEVMDIRPARSFDPNVRFVQVDVSDPEKVPENYTDSLSCLHALEHFGLGRYGDPLLADGWKRGIQSFSRLLQPQGRLYLSVPIGRQRIEFNAHRIFGPTPSSMRHV